MTEADFQIAYETSAFPPIAVTTDVVLFSTSGRDLGVALVERRDPPERGRLALPGTFVRQREELDHAARRVLADKADIGAPVRQFRAFGGVRRDPRLRVVSVAYMAALPAEYFEEREVDQVEMHIVRDGIVLDSAGKPLALPFDHADIVREAVADLRRNLDHTNWVFKFLPPEFSLRELQRVHEAIAGRTFNKPSFRQRMSITGWLEPTGRLETNTKFRPAELYRAREVRRER